eukprot:5347464-Pyramimonas_sp.AAC.1
MGTSELEATRCEMRYRRDGTMAQWRSSIRRCGLVVGRVSNSSKRPLLRLVLTLSIYRLPSCHWFSLPREQLVQGAVRRSGTVVRRYGNAVVQWCAVMRSRRP